MKPANNTFAMQFNELMAQYEAGIYTVNELVSVVIDLLSQAMTDHNWSYLPLWIQTKIVEGVNKLSQCDEIIAFGQVNPLQLKQQNESIKSWLIEKGYFGKPYAIT